MDTNSNGSGEQRFYLKQLREAAGLTLAQLGTIIGVTDMTILNYENARTDPSYRTHFKLAGLFGVSPLELSYGQPSEAETVSAEELRESIRQHVLADWRARLLASAAERVA